MTVTAAAQVLGTTARALRHRDALGLLPVSVTRGGHRRYGASDLEAARLVQSLEEAYGVGPAELAFAVRVLADTRLQGRVRALGLLTGALRSSEVAALDFEQRKAEQLLAAPRPRPVPGPSYHFTPSRRQPT